MSLKKFNRKTNTNLQAQANHQVDAGGRINLENNANFNGYRDLDNIYDQAPMKPNYTKEELANADIPTKIGREIRAQKYRIFLVAFISFLMIVISVFFIACYYGAKVVDTPNGPTKWLIPENNVPVPGAMIPLLVVGLLIFSLSMIEYVNLLTNVKSYKGEILMGRGGNAPQFLIKSYKSLISRVVYANWLALTLYVLEGIIIGIFWGVREIHNPNVYMHFNTELIIMYVIAGVTFLMHIFILLNSRYRRGNLDSYFNAQIISSEEQRNIRHDANKRSLICFLVFIAVITIVGIMVWLLLRRRKAKPPLAQ